MPRLTDTSPEAERVLAEVSRRMPGSRKLMLMCELIHQGQVMHESGLRRRQPGLSARAIRDDWIAAHYGIVPAAVGRKEPPEMLPLDAMRVVRDVVAACEAVGIAYVLGGSMASTFYGLARFTADADLSVEPFPGREADFASSFGDDYYVSVDAIRRAIRDRSSFNVIHTGLGFKADLFVRKDRPFDFSLMARRRPEPIDPNGPPVELVSAEDIVLLKLEWFRLGGESSDRQWSDIRNVLGAQADRLDDAYLDRWAAELGVLDLLGKARDEATL